MAVGRLSGPKVKRFAPLLPRVCGQGGAEDSAGTGEGLYLTRSRCPSRRVLLRSMPLSWQILATVVP